MDGIQLAERILIREEGWRVNMANLRIAFTGPGGSGKTTLANEIALILDLPLITEQFRTAARSLNYDPKRHKYDKWLATELLGVALQASHETAAQITGFVSDRTVYDYLAYMVAFAQINGAEYEEKASAAIMMRAITDKPDRYDLIFYVPPFSDTLEDDGFRYQDSEDKRVEEGAMKDILNMASDKLRGDTILLTVESITLKDRIEEVIEKINRWKEAHKSGESEGIKPE